MSKLPKEYQHKETLYKNIILFAAVVVMFVLYFTNILDLIVWLFKVLLPFIIGGILAFILDVISKGVKSAIKKLFKLEESKMLKTISNVVSIICLLLVLAIFVIFILPQIYNSIQSIFLNLPFALNNIYEWALKATRNVSTVHTWIIELNDILFAAEKGASETSNMLGMLADGQMGNIMNSIVALITTTVNTGLSVLIAVMFSIICLFNKETLIREVYGLLHAYLPDRAYQQSINGLQIVISTFTSYISGTCLECLILGTLIAVGCILLRLPYALLAGVLVGACALVPMFGAFVGGVFSCLIIAIQSPMSALYFMIMFVIIQQIEGNLIYPNVVGRSIGLPPMYIILAITLGGNIAGIIGMILFIPITSSVYQLVKAHARARILEKENQDIG
ncbi:MAG: AI-2E family transporter [Firmicutes bacterium]|nr:AI-2E family transporter [Bacillota bacterium]